VFAEDEARLLEREATSPEHLAAMVDRRAAGEPLEPLLGWAEFCGLRIAVEPHVFVPRRRTELLVHEAASRLRPGAVVVDMCCGTGAVGVALAAAVHGIELHAVDIDPAAVRCARRNVSAPGQVYGGDLFEPLSTTLRGRVHVILANAPYVPTEAVGLMPPEARLHEHRVALDGGVDGLDVQRRVAAAAPDWLAPGGHLLIETSDRQLPQTVATMRGYGLTAVVARWEDLDATVVIGSMPGR
jgi:release factor glutamine methyltransferase